MAKRRRKMSAKQLKYFGKKRTRTVYVKTKTKRRKKTMAKRIYKGYASRGIGGVKGMLPCIIGGVADSYLDPLLPIDGVGATAVGMFMHNSTLKDIGLYKVGFSIGNILPLPGRNGGTQGALL